DGSVSRLLFANVEAVFASLTTGAFADSSVELQIEGDVRWLELLERCIERDIAVIVVNDWTIERHQRPRSTRHRQKIGRARAGARATNQQGACFSKRCAPARAEITRATMGKTNSPAFA